MSYHTHIISRNRRSTVPTGWSCQLRLELLKTVEKHDLTVSRFYDFNKRVYTTCLQSGSTIKFSVSVFFAKIVLIVLM